MNINNLRKRVKISYYEPEEHDLDEYIFCTECGDYVVEYCAVHGALLVIPDTKVSLDVTTSPLIPRAALTIPGVFLHIAPSIIPGAGLGVFTTLTLPADVRFGPYAGDINKKIASPYCWQIYTAKRTLSHVVDAASPDRSNWMRYVNCSRHWNEQNLVAYQYRGEIYYRTLKIIPRNTELLVYYGTEYAKELGIDIRGYNDPKKYINFNTRVTKEKNAPYLSQDADEASSMLHETEQKNPNETIRINFEDDTVTFEEVNNNQQMFRVGFTNYDHNNHTNTIDDYNSSEQGQSRDGSTIESIDSAFNSDYNFNENQFNVNPTTTVDYSELNTTVGDQQYNNPIYIVTDKGYIQCQICNYQTYGEAGIKQHIRFHDPNRQFECHICHFKYFKRCSLKRHINSVHLNRSKYQCTACNAVFSKPIYLQNHQNSIHNESSENQHVLDDSKNIELHKEDSNLNNNNIQQNNSKINEECMHSDNKENETINSKCMQGDPITHNTAHEPNYEDVYGKRTDFDTNENLDKTELGQAIPYINKHNENIIKNYQDYYKIGDVFAKCNICGYKTVSQYHIKRHILLHDERRRFSCSICKLRFSERNSLFRHITSVHKAEKETCLRKYKTEMYRDETNDSTIKDAIGVANTYFGSEYTNIEMISVENNNNFVDNAIKTILDKGNTEKVLANAETTNDINSDFKYRKTDDLKFQCLNCDFKTFSENAIKKHLYLHDSRRKAICHICNCRFKSGYNLKIHIKSVHFGEKRLKCKQSLRGNIR